MGATARARGDITTSALLSWEAHFEGAVSPVKGFGYQSIHVSHTIVDGGILTDFYIGHRLNGTKWEQNEHLRLSPGSIVEVPCSCTLSSNLVCRLSITQCPDQPTTDCEGDLEVNLVSGGDGTITILF
ncbi:uncharacterized protein EV420DRAFT_1647420 [Desarmillaria tabescens]|uniref:Uncharacterized protein n=1 Tax=Armillaria tabescens TaxID=1929756 RepID=A0AA39MWC5_ARMTA|nr:uncharacterized protein EV420DRAFT_1647420 [Desarmillaria tabescens]KAK0448265.1 hypothetical protein EV420DRAFT_1647420 [Desarmillaria tabescens]